MSPKPLWARSRRRPTLILQTHSWAIQLNAAVQTDASTGEDDIFTVAHLLSFLGEPDF